LLPEIKHKQILIAPLDWGLGHAARSIPLIKHYVQNNTVFVGYTKLTKSFLEKELKNFSVNWVELPSYAITYNQYLPAWLSLLFDFFKIKKVIKLEYDLLQQIVVKYQINLIISDNRFGLYNSNCESYIITHQINIQSPIFSGLATTLNLKFLKKFNQIWVPDENNHLLSGNLSITKQQLNIKFIGVLSRFTKQNNFTNEIDLLILLSGPEPQRSILENKLILQFKTQQNVVLIRGTKNALAIDFGNIKIINRAETIELQKYILNAKKIICRSGYSTLMDLYAIGFDLKNVTLVPTPGQTEQEYLAKYWKVKFGCKIWQQRRI
jgi:hypothetical protein